MRAMRLGLLCGLAMGLAAGAATADPQTDEANRQRQMASMRQEAARADQASADRSLVQQQNAANAARQGANSGTTTGAGSSSAGAPWAGGSTAATSGPQSVVDSYTFTFRVEETTPQMLARLTAAANGGDGGAAYNLARIYYTGFEGAQRDDTAARRLFGQAARLGHPQSQANYGFFLQEGIGGPAEPQEARRWLKSASDAGNSFGQMQYAFSVWSEDPETASPLVIAAADAGEMGAQALAGSLYVMGYTVAQDDVLAVKYLKAAADQGEPGSKGLLAGLYLTGRGGGSEAEGYRLLKEGAEGGDADSMRNYGLMLVQGKGYPKDAEAGAAIVRKAAVGGDPKSQKLLGDLYNEGLGVPEHEEDTIYWWNRAAEAGDAEAIEAMSDVRTGGYAIGRAPIDGVGETARQAGRGK